MLKRLWLVLWIAWAVLIIGMTKYGEIASGEWMSRGDSAVTLLVAFGPYLIGRVLRIIVLGPASMRTRPQ